MADIIGADEKNYFIQETDGSQKTVPKNIIERAGKTGEWETKLASYQARNAAPESNPAMMIPGAMMPVNMPAKAAPNIPSPDIPQYPIQPTVTPMQNAPAAEEPATAAGFVRPALPVQSPAAQMPMTMSTTTEAPSSSLSQNLLSPEAEKKLNEADKKLKEATTAEMNANIKAIEVQTENDRKVGEENVKLSQIAQQNEATRLARMQEKQDDFDASVKELAGMKVDQGRIWRDKTTGDKIAVGIGVLLGAIGQGLTGGKSNYALDVIENAIDRDIAAQKADIATKGEVLGQKQNAIAMLRQRFGDERLAEIAFKDAAMEKVKLSILDKVAATKSDAVRARAQTASAQIDAGSADRLAERTKIIAAQTAGGGKTTVMVESPKPGARSEDPLWTSFGRAPDAEAAKTIRAADAAFKSGTAELNNFKSKISTIGPLSPYKWGTKEKGIWDASVESVKNTLREVKNMGVLQPSESKELESRLGGIKTPSQLTAYASELESWLTRSMQGKLTAYGIGGNKNAPYKPPSFSGK